MGLTNLKLMVPFCRTVKEGRKVLEVMAEDRPIEIGPFLLLDQLLGADIEGVRARGVIEGNVNVEQLHGGTGPLGDAQGER
jgi:hypothetical protein